LFLRDVSRIRSLIICGQNCCIGLAGLFFCITLRGVAFFCSLLCLFSGFVLILF
jgi:hypothetical protein